MRGEGFIVTYVDRFLSAANQDGQNTAFLDETRREEIEADIVVAYHGNTQWAVVSHGGGSRGNSHPMVIYAGLDSREAAVAARHEVLGQAINDGHVYGPSEVPITNFNELGKAQSQMKEAAR